MPQRGSRNSVSTALYPDAMHEAAGQQHRDLCHPARERLVALGDALIAATALEHDLDLVTRNADDFKHMPGLNWSNPFDQAPTT